MRFHFALIQEFSPFVDLEESFFLAGEVSVEPLFFDIAPFIILKGFESMSLPIPVGEALRLEPPLLPIFPRLSVQLPLSVVFLDGRELPLLIEHISRPEIQGVVDVCAAIPVFKAKERF